MNWRSKTWGPWSVYEIGDRVDSFNFSDLLSLFEESADKTHLALDLRRTRFVSIPAMRMMAEEASRRKPRGHMVALLSPSEKIKRQLDIFAEVHDLLILKNLDPPSVEMGAAAV